MCLCPEDFEIFKCPSISNTKTHIKTEDLKYWRKVNCKSSLATLQSLAYYGAENSRLFKRCNFLKVNHPYDCLEVLLFTEN